MPCYKAVVNEFFDGLRGLALADHFPGNNCWARYVPMPSGEFIA